MHVSQALLDGLLLGAVYGLMAAGLGLTWRATRTLNLDYGGLILLGSYAGYGLVRRLGIDPLLALPMAAAGVGILGWLLQRFILNRAVQADPLVRCLVTFGLLLLIIQATALAFGPSPRALLSRYTVSRFGSQTLSASLGQVVQCVAALGLLGGLAALLARTRWGHVIRATSLDEWVAFELGVDTGRVQALVGGLAGIVAGACGVLLVLTQPVSPGAGGFDMLAAFVACALLGPGDVLGALAGGLALGVTLSLVEAIAGSGWSDAAALALLLVVALIRRPLAPARPLTEAAA